METVAVGFGLRKIFETHLVLYMLLLQMLDLCLQRIDIAVSSRCS